MPVIKPNLIRENYYACYFKQSAIFFWEKCTKKTNKNAIILFVGRNLSDNFITL